MEEAPKNEEALKLKAKVDKDISKAGELFSEAKNLLKMAEFESVGRNIVGIQEIQNDLEIVTINELNDVVDQVLK